MNRRKLVFSSFAIGLMVLPLCTASVQAGGIGGSDVTGSDFALTSQGGSSSPFVQVSSSGSGLFDAVLLQNVSSQPVAVDLGGSLGADPLQLTGPSGMIVPQKVETSPAFQAASANAAAVRSFEYADSTMSSLPGQSLLSSIEAASSPSSAGEFTNVSFTRPVAATGGSSGGGIRRMVKQLLIPAGGIAIVGLALFGIVGLTRRYAY